jgi:serine/threonine protein kinase
MNDHEESVFAEALAKADPEERAAFLDRACSGNAALRASVESLLAAYDAGCFLESPVMQPTPPNRANQEPTGATEAGTPDPDDARASLTFLTPSGKPDSAGRLGHYEVQEVIGRGGMGVVLRAFDEELHRVVAIKVMAQPLATNATARKRFKREAQAVAAVTHDHIVTIHAVEEANGLPYLVMQYVAGLSLQQRLDRDGPLELQEVLRIGMQTASGLAAAHAQGLVHRDIKPANILLENGVERVKLTDFGLARAAADANLTQSGMVAGTPQYMSPEQAEGRAVDPRTDLFSLGSVLYAMCTGRAPFRASGTLAVLKRVCEETPTPIRETNPGVPDWLVAIIDKLHAKDPGRRYQSAAEVAALLGRHLAQVQHPSVVGQASGVPPEPKAASRPSRRRRLAIAAAVLVCLVAGLSLTEAAGVTDLRAAVIRLFTPDGTLVVETDDPAVKVTVEGDGDLVITGAGPQEVRLRAGSYRLKGTKDGKPVKLDRDLVSIARGDRQIVRVRLEDEPAAAVVPGAEAGAFVVLGGTGVAERRFDTLAEAVLNAGDGDTIEVRGNGPFVTRPITIGTQKLTIRAATGRRPRLRWVAAGGEGRIDPIQSEGPLVLEGLDLVHDGPPPHAPLIRPGSALYAANCRFLVVGLNNCVWVQSRTTRCVLRNCEILAPGGAAIGGYQGQFDNCLVTAGNAFGFHSPLGDRAASFEMTRTTFLGTHVTDLRFEEWPGGEGGRPEPWLRVRAFSNILGTTHVVAAVQGRSAVRGAGVLPPEKFEAVLKRAVVWQGDRNVYPDGDEADGMDSFRFDTSADGPGRSWKHGPKDLAAWGQFWGSPERDSAAGRVRFKGGDIRTRAASDPDGLTPDDYRLRPDSTGFRAGKGGKDLGADVDLVGPGAAYERWKRTAAYQQWLKDTGQGNK